MYEITSKNNEIIKFIKSLGTAKNRRKEGLFVLEGRRFVQDALYYGVHPKYILTTGSTDLIDMHCECIHVSESIFNYISDVKTPQGLIAVCEIPRFDLDGFVGNRSIYLENVQMSENVGAIIRSAACCGFDSVFLSPDTADAYSGKSVRASAANIFKIKIFTDITIKDIVNLKESKKLKIIGAHLNGREGTPISSDNFILVVGNEGNGLSLKISEICDELIRIPISKNCESLNVACAATVLMYKSIGYL